MKNIILIISIVFLGLSGGILLFRYTQYQNASNYFGDIFASTLYWLSQDNKNVNAIEYTRKYQGTVQDMAFNGKSLSGNSYSVNFISINDADGNSSGVIGLPQTINENNIFIEKYHVDGTNEEGQEQVTSQELINRIKTGDKVYFWIHKDRTGTETISYFSIIEGI